jgi:hypothetical protein
MKIKIYTMGNKHSHKIVPVEEEPLIPNNEDKSKQKRKKSKDTDKENKPLVITEDFPKKKYTSPSSARGTGLLSCPKDKKKYNNYM